MSVFSGFLSPLMHWLRARSRTFLVPTSTIADNCPFFEYNQHLHNSQETQVANPVFFFASQPCLPLLVAPCFKNANTTARKTKQTKNFGWSITHRRLLERNRSNFFEPLHGTQIHEISEKTHKPVAAQLLLLVVMLVSFFWAGRPF